MFVGTIKTKYKDDVMESEACIVVKDINDYCTNARGEDFSYLYDWYILDITKLKKVKG